MRPTFLLTVLALVAACGSAPRQTSATLAYSTACPDAIAWDEAAMTGLNRSVVTFARGKLGQRVDRGECTDLADQALRGAGAKTAYQLGPLGLDANYVWGTLVSTITAANKTAAGILPGDILQYRDVSQSVDIGAFVWSSHALHHTSVVKAVSADGQHLCVFEQNANGRRTVGTGYLSLAGLTAGTLWVYRPRL